MDGRTTRLSDVPRVLVGALTEPRAMQRSPLQEKKRQKKKKLLEGCDALET